MSSFLAAAATSASAGVGIGAGLAISLKSRNPADPFPPNPSNSLLWPSLLLLRWARRDLGRAEHRLGFSHGSRRRPEAARAWGAEEDRLRAQERRCLLGIRCFRPGFANDVRLQIVYGGLSIHSVCSAFEESVGNRLQKFGGSENKDMLQRFTSLFKDEYKLPPGSIIDLSKEHGFILQTRIDGKVVGSIQSKLLCQSVFDLYIGEDPFDRNAKEDFKG